MYLLPDSPGPVTFKCCGLCPQYSVVVSVYDNDIKSIVSRCPHKSCDREAISVVDRCLTI